jgi:hypothetical protein
MKKILIVFILLLSTTTYAQENRDLDKSVLDIAIKIPDQLSNKDMLSQCCKVCIKGCPCGNTCISCTKDCHIGPGCACREQMELGNQTNMLMESDDCKI